MNEKVFNKATEYIDAIAAKLGVAAEHVFEILVRQQFATGIADIILGVALLSVLITIIVVTVKAFTKAEYKHESERYFSSSEKPINGYARMRDFIEDSDGLFWLPYTAVTAILAILSIGCLYYGILELINPEYYAIKELLEVISGD
jgi:hypothetical protein